MTYTVLVDDNAHHMDDTARYRLGEYATLEEAVEAARRLVDAWLEETHTPGMTGEALFREYLAWGEDPFVVGPGEVRVPFSAWDRARERAREVAQGAKSRP
jgi:hypothetical protein